MNCIHFDQSEVYCFHWQLPTFKNQEIHVQCTCVAAKSLQLCPTLCDPIDGSPPGSPVPGTLQARTLEWVAISFSNAWKWKVKGKSLGRVRLFTTPWTAAYQAPPSMGFSREEYWSGVPLPSPKGDIVRYNYMPTSTGWSLGLCWIFSVFTFLLKLFLTSVCSSVCAWYRTCMIH